jgi:universal stress protein F
LNLILIYQFNGEIALYKSILIPVDMANVAKLNTMIDSAFMQSDSNSKIMLLNVVEEIPSWAAVELPRGIVDKSVRSSLEELQVLAGSMDTKMDVEVRTGHPYKTILEVAEEKNVDLIIVASHQPGLQDYFLGSTAAKVVRHAKCSVQVVR